LFNFEVDKTKIYTTKFYHRHQRHNESVQEYSAELKRLYDKGFPQRDKVTRQEDLLRAFFLGLQDDDARVHVELNKEPKSIDEAVSPYHFRQQLLQITFLYDNIVRFYLPI
jgi:hypothetical protein